jgi:hypothetical protein
VGDTYGTVERNNRAFGEGGIAAQAGATGETGGELGAKDVLAEVGIDFWATHRVLLDVSRQPFRASVYHFRLYEAIAGTYGATALTVFLDVNNRLSVTILRGT